MNEGDLFLQQSVTTQVFTVVKVLRQYIAEKYARVVFNDVTMAKDLNNIDPKLLASIQEGYTSPNINKNHVLYTNVNYWDLPDLL